MKTLFAENLQPVFTIPGASQCPQLAFLSPGVALPLIRSWGSFLLHWQQLGPRLWDWQRLHRAGLCGARAPSLGAGIAHMPDTCQVLGVTLHWGSCSFPRGWGILD